jgi:site-specific recombinase XerD
MPDDLTSLSSAKLLVDVHAPPPIELAVVAWLDAKRKRTDSKRTEQVYRDTLAAFRSRLQAAGLELDGDPRAIALLAQIWAGEGEGAISAATYNQRLAILSSFYTFAHKASLLDGANPIDRVERARVQAYASATALTPSEVQAKLKSIDRSTLDGLRDHALLLVGMSTGRRASELAALRWKHVTTTPRVILLWARTKGGKTMRDELEPRVGRTLLAYMYAVYGNAIGQLAPDTPVWVSFSPRNRGEAISAQTIGHICERYLGTSKVHTLRHTFANSMLKAKADVRDIQQRLGHANLATTSIYLDALQSAENPYASAVADLFGLE